MTYKVDIRHKARADILEAFSRYEGQRPGLGSDFLKTVDQHVELIGSNPSAYQIVHQDMRRSMLPRFPYVLLYRIDDDTVLITGCYHTSRDPKVWLEYLE